MPYGCFLLKSLLLGMLHCLFLKVYEPIDFLTRVPNLLFSDLYLNLLFNFKIGLPLGPSYLMPSMFIVLLIICIIKVTCFDNTILIVELEGKVP